MYVGFLGFIVHLIALLYTTDAIAIVNEFFLVMNRNDGDHNIPPLLFDLRLAGTSEGIDQIINYCHSYFNTENGRAVKCDKTFYLPFLHSIYDIVGQTTRHNIQERDSTFLIRGMFYDTFIRVNIGKGSYGYESVAFKFWDEDNAGINIGRYVQFAGNIIC